MWSPYEGLSYLVSEVARRDGCVMSGGVGAGALLTHGEVLASGLANNLRTARRTAWDGLWLGNVRLVDLEDCSVLDIPTVNVNNQILMKNTAAIATWWTSSWRVLRWGWRSIGSWETAIHDLDYGVTSLWSRDKSTGTTWHVVGVGSKICE